MIPRSFVSPELLAHIVYEKYCNAMPLYRLEKDFAAKGVEYCNRLFLLERTYNGEDEKGNRIAEPLTTEHRHIKRQIHSKPRVSKKLT